MKYFLYILVVVFLGIGSLTAQQEEIRFGVKGGLNLVSVSGNNSDAVITTPAFHIGGMMEVPLLGKLAFQPELLFSVQNSKFESSSLGYTGRLTTKLNYLNIPLMAKFYAFKGFSVQFGPQIGVLLSSKAEYEILGLSAVEEALLDFLGGSRNELSIDKYTHGLDLALNFGFGYQLQGGLYFETRYSFGLLNVINEDTDELNLVSAYLDEEIIGHNAVLSFAIGYTF